MPRKASGKANGSDRRASKRERQDEERDLRHHWFRTMAEQTDLVFNPVSETLHAYLDPYEWTLFARPGAKEARRVIPPMLRMGSCFGWIYSQIDARERVEERRATAREDAETQHRNRLLYARVRGLLQWVPQPVPDDFVCPYTGDVADKRKILSVGDENSDGHDTLVSYRTSRSDGWYIAREQWDGTYDAQGNRLSVKITRVPFGDVVHYRPLQASMPGLPYRGTPGFSGQSGKPVLRPSGFPKKGSVDPDVIVESRTGYPSERDAIKQAMYHVLEGFLGARYIDLARRSRLRGGKRENRLVRVSITQENVPLVPPNLTAHIVTGTNRDGSVVVPKKIDGISPTVPSHLWGGVIRELPGPFVHKTKRGQAGSPAR